MPTSFRGRIYDTIRPPSDGSTMEAIERARTLAPIYQSVVYQAKVDRFDGLLLLFGGTEAGGWHFQTPLSGYEGDGPQAAAEILEIFGFGPADELLEITSRRHYYVFTL